MASGGGTENEGSIAKDIHVTLDKQLVFRLMKAMTDTKFKHMVYYFKDNPLREGEMQNLNSSSDLPALWELLLQKKSIRRGEYTIVKECFEAMDEEDLKRIVENQEKLFPTEVVQPEKDRTAIAIEVKDDDMTKKDILRPSIGGKSVTASECEVGIEVKDDHDVTKKDVLGYSNQGIQETSAVGDELGVREAHRALFHQKLTNLLKVLDFSKYFPKKLSLQELMCKPMPQTEGIHEAKDLPWLILLKLVMNDYTGRDYVLSSASKPTPEPYNPAFEDSVEVLEDLVESVASLCSPGPASGPENFHPMDVFYALFSSADLMLRQILVQKMFMCRLAVPLLLNDATSGKLQMCLWSLRTIVTEWRDCSKIAKEVSIVKHQTHIISFIKINKPSMSKSQLVNGVLNDTNHPTFFHIDCIGGRRERQLANGTVEASWFLPTGCEDALIQTPITVLNLRGNSINHRKQVQLLLSVSSAMVVLIEYADMLLEDQLVTQMLGSIHNSAGHVILLITCAENDIPESDKMRATFKKYCQTVGGWKKCVPILCFDSGVRRSSREITRDIKSKMAKIVADNGRRSLEELCVLAKKQGFIIDEDDADCQLGLRLAGMITKEMDGRSLKYCKETMLPLQGEPWLKWCEHQRKQQRSGTKVKGTTHDDKSRLQEEKIRYRTEQLKRYSYKPMIVERFVQSLSDNVENHNTVAFFMQWLRMYFNDRSRDTLPPLRQEYSEHWKRFCAAKKSGTDDLGRLREEINHLGQELLDFSFGLEHLLREVGQLYEAATEAIGQKGKVAVSSGLSNLPKIAAKLLLQGHPLEIMDGSASMVPVCWVRAIFKALRGTVGNKKLFVISVLGIQSSGKSTLLNTMFGLQFPVNAGRCTRGLYMQLLEVEANRHYDYIMVLDTEGLRAPELESDNYDHDNELATLVIGLGDVTILNIQGPNVAEMKDVLQIVVHAFLRMKIVNKKINLQQSCIFIHQNVSGVAASEQMMLGRNKLLETLDELTKQAAIQVKVSDMTTFRKIMDFDEVNHVWYFSNLWQGDPPTAAANPGYSECVRKVKNCILNDIAEKKSFFLTFEGMESHIDDLSKGILSEDFVFSFRSSLAVKAYVNLEEYTWKLSWKLRKHVIDWLQNTATTSIEGCADEHSLQNTVHVLIANITDDCRKVVEKDESRLDAYFEKDSLRHISIQWKEDKKESLHLTKKTCLKKVKEELERLKSTRQVDLTSTRNNIVCKIRERARGLSNELKGERLTDKEIQQAFKDMWDECLSKLELQKPRDDTTGMIVTDVTHALFEWLTAEAIYLRPELDVQPIQSMAKDYPCLSDSINDIELTENHLSAVNDPIFVLGCTDEEEVDLTKHFDVARQKIAVILRRVEVTLSDICSRDTKFQEIFAEQVVQLVIDGIETHNRSVCQVNGQFTFLPNFKVKLAAHVSRFALQQFIQMHHAYEKKHGLNAKLAELEEELSHDFKNTIQNCESEKVAADLVTRQLRIAVEKSVEKRRTDEMIEDTCMEFNNKKYYLMTKILEDLAEKDNFIHYCSYIAESSTYVELWLKAFMEEKYFSSDEKDREQLCDKWVSSVVRTVRTGLADTLSYIQDKQNPSIAAWVEELCRSLKHVSVYLSEGGMTRVVEHDVTNFERFHSLLNEQLEQMKNALLKDVKATTARSIKWPGETPYKQVFDKLWGCKEQCPFCNAPCRVGSGATHRHQCIQHRPEGIGGNQWLYKRELLTETCNFNVQSSRTFRCMPCKHQESGNSTQQHVEAWHKYKDYHKYFPDWEIAPDSTPHSNKYWMWFMARYLRQLTGFHRAKEEPQLPESWSEITKEQAIESLHSVQ